MFISLSALLGNLNFTDSGVYYGASTEPGTTYYKQNGDGTLSDTTETLKVKTYKIGSDDVTVYTTTETIGSSACKYYIEVDGTKYYTTTDPLAAGDVDFKPVDGTSSELTDTGKKTVTVAYDG